jgi:TonB family protein
MGNLHQTLKRMSVAVAIISLCFVFRIEAFGQQGRLMGRVLDSSGKPVAGATIYITSTTVTQAAVSNAQGYYTFLNVPPETYKIRTYKRGYSTWNSELAVVANSITRVDVKLGTEEAEENVVFAETKKSTSTAVKKTVPVEKKKESVEVVAVDKTPEMRKEIVAQLKSDNDEDDKGAEELINLTEENINADDMEQVATLESNVEIVGGVEQIYKNIKYPDLALKAGVEGKAIAQVFVDKSGNIVKVNFLKSINPILDAEVMRVLTEDTQFKPARVSGGKTVAGAIVIPFNFKIKK